MVSDTGLAYAVRILSRAIIIAASLMTTQVNTPNVEAKLNLLDSK